MAMVTTATLTPAQQFMVDKALLKRALPSLQYGKFGQRRPLGKNKGTQVKFRRYNSLGTATTPLTEGVTPVGQALSVTDVMATPVGYGNYVTLSDYAQLTEFFPLVAESTKLLGEQAGQSIDVITRDILCAGTNVVYAGTATSRATVDANFSEAKVRVVARTLERQNAKALTEMLNPTTGIGTTPLNACFVGICHPDLTAALRNATNFPSFIPVEKYPSQMKTMDEEIGALGRIRFVASSQAKVFADSGVAVGATGMISTSGTLIDVYATIVLGSDAYGITELEGEGLRTIAKALGSGGSADPLDQRSTAGWKSYHTAEILNDLFMVRLEHGCPTAP